MRYVLILAVILIAAVSCTESGGIDPSAGQVVIDGTVYVAVTATPGGAVEPTTTPDNRVFTWDRIDGDVIGDVLLSPVPSRWLPRGVLGNPKDIVYWNGQGSASWTISGSDLPRTLIVQRSLLVDQDSIRFQVTQSGGGNGYAWPAETTTARIKPGADSVTITVNASPSTLWAISVALLES